MLEGKDGLHMIPTNQDYDARISYMSAVPMFHEMMNNSPDLLARAMNDPYRPTEYSEECPWHWNTDKANRPDLADYVFELMNAPDDNGNADGGPFTFTDDNGDPQT